MINLLLVTSQQILSAVQGEFNISSVYIDYWDCNQQLKVFSSEGIVRLQIPSEIAADVVKISYSVATSVKGNVFYFCRV